ncbi:MAG: hypothetical protein ACXVLQ_09385 [Bacteriovorax sp.]
MTDLKQKYYSHCLKADLGSALRSLLKEGKSIKNGHVDLFRKKAVARFIKKNEKDSIKSDDDFVKSIIRAYRAYYREVLLNPNIAVLLERNLIKSLKDIAVLEGLNFPPRVKTEILENVLKDALRKRGYFSLFGVVRPFRSLLVWKSEKRTSYKVVLPEKTQKLDVVFLETFIELGWLHYATFGKYYVGGWAKKDALYCVKQAYKLNSLSFKVHYLSHEAQHFSDYKLFPNLSQVDLEYRAKLTELALTRTPKRFLLRLQNEAKRDEHIPHSFAAYKILSDIDETSHPKIIRTEAVRLLRRHTEELKRHGAGKVKSVLL